jgi:hypothetical protein
VGVRAKALTYVYGLTYAYGLTYQLCSFARELMPTRSSRGVLR